MLLRATGQRFTPMTSPPHCSERPLSALLSQILVAFTIEVDNAFELRMRAAGSSGAGLSLVVWSNLLQYARQELSVGDLVAESLCDFRSVRHMLGCLERWEVVALGHDAEDKRPEREGWGSGRGINLSTLIQPKRPALQASELWPEVLAAVEKRWRDRFGVDEIGHLRVSLAKIIGQTDLALPRGFIDIRERKGPFRSKALEGTHTLPLATLLAQALMLFALEFEPQSTAPLALAANTVRVLSETPVPAGDLATLTGCSPEMAGIGWQIKPYIVVKPARLNVGKLVSLSPRGLSVQENYQRLAREIEKSWEKKFGEDAVRSLRNSCLYLFREGKEGGILLSEALVPPLGVVRSGVALPALGRRVVRAAAQKRMRDMVRQTEAFVSDPAGSLPHYPMWDMNRGFGP
jgi:hypothetical protein